MAGFAIILQADLFTGGELFLPAAACKSSFRKKLTCPKLLFSSCFQYDSRWSYATYGLLKMTVIFHGPQIENARQNFYHHNAHSAPLSG